MKNVWKPVAIAATIVALAGCGNAPPSDPEPTTAHATPEPTAVFVPKERAMLEQLWENWPSQQELCDAYRTLGAERMSDALNGREDVLEAGIVFLPADSERFFVEKCF